jgi:GT2 family glycosyltransferase
MSKNRNRTYTPTKQAKVDICILEAGRFDMLSKCLDSVYQEAQLLPINVYIVDNGTDPKERLEYKDLLAYQKEKDPTGNVIKFESKRLPQNLGFPQGSNELAKMGNAPYIVFVGDDVELLPGTIEKIVNDFESMSDVNVVGIKLLFPTTSTNVQRPAGKVQHCGMAVNIQGVPIHPLVGWSDTHPKTNVSRDVWAVTGAVFAIRRNVFNKLGGFDPVYGLGTHEDLDLCMKVRQAGGRVWFDALAKAYHYVGATAEKLQVNFPLQQNRNIFMSRWQGSGLVYWTEYEFW